MKINEAFRGFPHAQVKIIKEKSYIKMIYNVKINQIYITLVCSPDTISKKMQALYYQYTPTFAKLKGNFISSIDKKQAEKKVIKKLLLEHHNNLKHLKGRHYKIINELLKLLGKVILRILLIDLCNSLRKSNILQLKAKNNKMRIRRPKHANKTSQVPVKNLSDYNIDTSSLK